MTELNMDKEQIIALLRSDDNYYGEFGRNFLSNSDLIDLLTDIPSFGKPTEKTVEMLQGTYMHLKLFEPEKFHFFQNDMVVEASSRNTKIYKEAKEESGQDLLLLKGETEILDRICKKAKSNVQFYDEMYAEGNKFEEPNIVELFGNWWKCKADVETAVSIPDFKSTSDINKFARSAYTYNYDSAAYIYEQAFGKRMVFWVGCKKTEQLGRVTCSDEFIEGGKQKVIKATTIYNRFFGPNATEDPNDFVIEFEL